MDVQTVSYQMINRSLIPTSPTSTLLLRSGSEKLAPRNPSERRNAVFSPDPKGGLRIKPREQSRLAKAKYERSDRFAIVGPCQRRRTQGDCRVRTDVEPSHHLSVAAA